MHSVSMGKGISAWHGLISWEFVHAVFLVMAVSSAGIGSVLEQPFRSLPGRAVWSGSRLLLTVPHTCIYDNGEEAFPILLNRDGSMII